MNPPKTQIALVDDAVEWATALQSLLDAEPDLAVVTHCGSLTEAAETLPKLRPEIVLLDLQLPDGLGSSLIPHLASVLPDCRFLILTAAESDDAIRTSIVNGADGYILKRAGFSRIVAAIRELRDGETPFCRWVAKRLLNLIRESSSPHRILRKLSPRENELVRLICGDGVSVKEAAFQLKLTHASARTYLQRIYRKLGVATRWELDRAYFNLGRPTASQPSLPISPGTPASLPTAPLHGSSRFPSGQPASAEGNTDFGKAPERPPLGLPSAASASATPSNQSRGITQEEPAHVPEKARQSEKAHRA